MPRALTFDYWDTLYEGGALPERVALRRTAVGALLGAYGRALPEEQLRVLYEESGREAERWWSEEQRGYTTNERLRWILERAAVKPREGCEHVAAAADAVDNALLMLPPARPPAREGCRTRVLRRDDLLDGRRPREAAPRDLPPRGRDARRPGERDRPHRRQRAHRREGRTGRRLPRDSPRRRPRRRSERGGIRGEELRGTGRVPAPRRDDSAVEWRVGSGGWEVHGLGMLMRPGAVAVTPHP